MIVRFFIEKIKIATRFRASMSLFLVQFSEVYLEPSRTSAMELFANNH